MPEKIQIKPGIVIGDTYRLSKQIGAGGMGEVWLAEHTRLPGLLVAVKFLFGGQVNEEEFNRFQREAYIMASLYHPHITKVIDLNTLIDGSPYIVLEYLEGEPLSNRLERGSLSPQEICHIIAQVGSALQATHSKEIIHRDLKPDNIFLCDAPDSDLPHVKVLDFGVSKVRSQGAKITVKEQGFLGTPQYMSPEQARGNADVDQAADQFSLGIITYEMLSGYLPFGGEQLIHIITSIIQSDPIPLRELVPSLSAGVERVVHKALSKAKEDRYISCNAYVSDLVKEMLSSTAEPDDWDIESLTEIISAGGDGGGEPEEGDTVTMRTMADFINSTQPDLLIGGIEGDDQTKVEPSKATQGNQGAKARTMSPQDELVKQAISLSSLWSTPQGSPPAALGQLKEWEASRGQLSSIDPLVNAQQGFSSFTPEQGVEPLRARTDFQSKRPLILAGLVGGLCLLVILLSSLSGDESLASALTRMKSTKAPPATEIFAPYQGLIQSVKLSTDQSSKISSPELITRMVGRDHFELDPSLGLEVTAYVTLSKSALKAQGMSHTELRGSWSAETLGQPKSLTVLGDASDAQLLTLSVSHFFVRSEPKRWYFGLTHQLGVNEDRALLVSPFELKEGVKRRSPPSRKKSRRRNKKSRGKKSR